MKVLLAAMFFISISAQGAAEGQNKVATSTTSGPITYELRDLKPNGITQYTAAGEIIRQYYEFQNEQGTHHVIYEEVPTAPSLRTVAGLREAARIFESRCAIDIECSSKAFCINDCHNMYYEMANAPGDEKAPERNKCKVLFFSCQRQSAAPCPLETPPPAAQPTAKPEGQE